MEVEHLVIGVRIDGAGACKQAVFLRRAAQKRRGALQRVDLPVVRAVVFACVIGRDDDQAVLLAV